MWYKTKPSKSSSPAIPPSDMLESYNFKLLSDASTYGYVFLETTTNLIYKLVFVSKKQKALLESQKVTMTNNSIRSEIVFQKRAGTIAPAIIDTYKMHNADAISFINQLQQHLDTKSALAHINKTTTDTIHTELMRLPQLQLYVIKMKRLDNYSLSELIIRQDIQTNFDNAYACVLKKVLQLFLDKHCIHMDMHTENIFMSTCSEKDPICTCNLIDYGIMFDMDNLQSPAQKGIIQHYRDIMNFDYSADVRDIRKNAVKYADLFKLESEDACQVIHNILHIIVGVDLANSGFPQCRDFINYIYGQRDYDIVTHPIFDWNLADPVALNKLHSLWAIIVHERRTIQTLRNTRKLKHTHRRTINKTRTIKSI